MRYSNNLDSFTQGCTKEVVKVAWNRAIAKQSRLAMRRSQFEEFCLHFRLSSYINITMLNSVVSNVVPEKDDLTFSQMLEILCVIAVTFFASEIEDDHTSETEKFCNAFSALLRSMDPAEHIFLHPDNNHNHNHKGRHSPPPPTNDNNNPFSSSQSLSPTPTQSFSEDLTTTTIATLAQTPTYNSSRKQQQQPLHEPTNIDKMTYYLNLPFAEEIEGIYYQLLELEAILDTKSDASNPKAPTNGNSNQKQPPALQKGVSKKLLFLFAKQCGFFDSSRLTLTTLTTALRKAELYQHNVDEKLSKNNTKKRSSTFDLPTNSFSQLQRKPTVLNRKRAKTRSISIDEKNKTFFSFLAFANFICRIACVRVGLPPNKVITEDGKSFVLMNAGAVSGALLLFMDERLPAPKTHVICDYIGGMILKHSNNRKKTPNHEEAVFKQDVIQALVDSDDAIRLAFSFGIAAAADKANQNNLQNLHDLRNVHFPCLRITTLESLGAGLPGDVALALLNLVGLCGVTPFDELETLLWASSMSSSIRTSTSFSSFTLSLGEFGLLVGKLATNTTNCDSKKAGKRHSNPHPHPHPLTNARPAQEN